MDLNSLLPWVGMMASAVAAIWVWYTKSYLPTHQEKERDIREDRQRKGGDALSQVIALNERLVDDKIETTNATLLDIQKELRVISSNLQKLHTSERINRQEWERTGRSIEDVRDQVRQIRDSLRDKANINYGQPDC